MPFGESLLSMHPAWKFLLGEVLFPNAVLCFFPFIAWARGKLSKWSWGRKIARVPAPPSPRVLTPEEQRKAAQNIRCPSCDHEHPAVCVNCTPFVPDSNIETLVLDYLQDPNALRYEVDKFARHMDAEDFLYTIDQWELPLSDGRKVTILIQETPPKQEGQAPSPTSAPAQPAHRAPQHEPAPAEVPLVTSTPAQAPAPAPRADPRDMVRRLREKSHKKHRRNGREPDLSNLPITQPAAPREESHATKEDHA